MKRLEKREGAEGRTARVAFEAHCTAEAGSRNYPARSAFEEDPAARQWLMDWLKEARIHIDSELFWLCYENPDPLDPDEAPPDLAGHLERTVHRFCRIRQNFIAGFIYDGQTLFLHTQDRFSEALPVMAGRGGMPRSLRAYAAGRPAGEGRAAL